VTLYNPKSGEGRLFVDYVNKCLKLKAEASGYPGWAHSPESQDRYVFSFWQSDVISVDKEANRYNAIKRVVAKICPNPCGENWQKETIEHWQK